MVIKLLGKRIVWTVHNVTDHSKRHKDLEVFFARLLARYSDEIIVHCETAKQTIRSTFQIADDKRITVIPHGSFFGIYCNEISREVARDYLRLSSKDFVFLFLGLIRYYKGLIELVESFSNLGAKDVKLVIAGNVKNEELALTLKEKVKTNGQISYHPRSVPDEEIQYYMKAADTFVIPYRDVLTSGAAILAMSFGRPIIAPKIGCLKDILQDSGAFLYDPTHEQGLLEAMKAAIESKDEMHTMGIHNLKIAENLNWPQIAKLTANLYRQCCN